MGKNDVLRQKQGGLNKKQVLERVDALLLLSAAVQSGSMFREQALEEAQRLVNEPFEKAFIGFREDDVQEYLRKLLENL